MQRCKNQEENFEFIAPNNRANPFVPTFCLGSPFVAAPVWYREAQFTSHGGSPVGNPLVWSPIDRLEASASFNQYSTNACRGRACKAPLGCRKAASAAVTGPLQPLGSAPPVGSLWNRHPFSSPQVPTQLLLPGLSLSRLVNRTPMEFEFKKGSLLTSSAS